jgi:hypothetical protein
VRVLSDLVRESGVDEMISYLLELGGSPILNNGTWDNERFDLQNLFYREPDHATFLFLDHKLLRCKDPRNTSSKVLCFRMNNGWKFGEKVENDTLDILKPLQLDSDVKVAAVKNFIEFLQIKRPLQNKFSKTGKAKIVQIKNLKEMFPNLDLDWLKIVNLQLMEHSQKSEDDEIMIENPELMQQLATVLTKLDKK